MPPRQYSTAGAIVIAVPGSREPRERRVRRRVQARRRISPAVVVLGIAAVAAIVAFAVREWMAGQVEITFAAAGEHSPQLELTVYPDRLTFTSPSPPPPLGLVDLEGGLSTTLDDSLVPERAVVRYRGEGVGAGVVYVRLGEPVPVIELETPRTIHGRVGEPIPSWSYGWRCAGMMPVADAEVIAMAGGERGIELARATTGADGAFELTGVAPSVHPLSLRVRAPGYALTHVDVPAAVASDQDVTVALQRTVALRGRIEAPPDVDLQSLWVLARGLPGVQAVPDADGTFVLAHIPPRLEPRLLVDGLGVFHGCPEVRATREGPVVLVVHSAGVVRGTTVDAMTGATLPGAFVFSPDGAATRSDAAGSFELRQVLPGNIEVTAQYQPAPKPRQRRGAKRFGRVRVEVRAGEVVEGVTIKLSVR